MPQDRDGSAPARLTGATPQESDTDQGADSQSLAGLTGVKSTAAGYAGWDYRRQGWQRPIPIPAPDDTHDGKGPPPTGYTGRAGLTPGGADIQAWTEDRPTDNTAVVMHDGIVGIDVDHYGDKRGGDTIASHERLWGSLPVGPRSTSRPDDPISGIRFFRVPEGAAFVTVLDGGGVEIIQPHHRYAVVRPSVHHEGRQYVWLDGAGSITDIPAADELPWLPDAWVTGMFCSPSVALGADFGIVNIKDTFTDGEPDDRVARQLEDALDRLTPEHRSTRYDSTLRASLALMRLGRNGHPGVAEALQQLGDGYVDAVKDDRRGGVVIAVSEYKRMLHSPGARRALGVPSHQEATRKADEQFFADMRREREGMTTGTDTKEEATRNGRRIQLTWASEIEAAPVVWAWRGELTIDSIDPLDSRSPDSRNLTDQWKSMDGLSGRIPAGSIALAAGPEGVGKSSFGTLMAARVSNGTLPGAWFGTPRCVLYATVEDSWKYTIIPRLTAAAADLTKIARIEVATVGDETVTMSLPTDNTELEYVINQNGVALVVLDPLLSLISDSIDSHTERDVRKALDPLAAMADRTGAVLLGIAHWNKSAGTDVAARITGSGAFKNVPRAIFGFIRDPESETGECVMQQAKNSLGRYDLPSLRYRIESAQIETPTGTADTGVFVVCGESERTVSEILASKKSSEDPDDSDEDGYTPPQQFIIRYLLNDVGGPAYEARSKDVTEAGKKAGYSHRTLIKARNQIKSIVHSRRVGFGKGGDWVWQLDPNGDHVPAHSKREGEQDKETQEGTE